MYLNFNSRCLSCCPPSPGPSVETKAAQPPWPEAVLRKRHVSRPPTSPNSEIKNPLRDQNLSILAIPSSPRHSPLRHRLRTCRACWRRYQKRMQSSLAPPGRAIRRPLIGWPLPTWRVCQREAPHPVAGGGRWRRSDRDGPVNDARLDQRPCAPGPRPCTPGLKDESR